MLQDRNNAQTTPQETIAIALANAEATVAIVTPDPAAEQAIAATEALEAELIPPHIHPEYAAEPEQQPAPEIKKEAPANPKPYQPPRRRL
jgi:hypothetical protein